MEVLYGHRGGVGGRGVGLSSPGCRWRVTSRDPLPDLLGIHILCKQSGSLLAIPSTRQFPLTRRGEQERGMKRELGKRIPRIAHPYTGSSIYRGRVRFP